LQREKMNEISWRRNELRESKSTGGAVRLAVQKKNKAPSTAVNETKTKSRACGALWCWESDPATETETGLKTRRQLEPGRPESTRAQNRMECSPARADETVTESAQRREKLGGARRAKPRPVSVCYCPKTKIPKSERSGQDRRPRAENHLGERTAGRCARTDEKRQGPSRRPVADSWI
jgi:hypothetical protein